MEIKQSALHRFVNDVVSADAIKFHTGDSNYPILQTFLMRYHLILHLKGSILAVAMEIENDPLWQLENSKWQPEEIA